MTVFAKIAHVVKTIENSFFISNSSVACDSSNARVYDVMTRNIVVTPTLLFVLCLIMFWKNAFKCDVAMITSFPYIFRKPCDVTPTLIYGLRM